MTRGLHTGSCALAAGDSGELPAGLQGKLSGLIPKGLDPTGDQAATAGGTGLGESERAGAGGRFGTATSVPRDA